MPIEELARVLGWSDERVREVGAQLVDRALALIGAEMGRLSGAAGERARVA